MPQEFQVLQCYSCQTFQVHQVKKAKKWACKMCGEKQSIIKVYGRGTGAECRQHVQTLNTHRGEMDLLKETLSCNEGFQEASNYPQYNDDDDGYSINVQESGKWNQFVEKDPGNAENNDNDDDFDDGQFTTDASLLNKRGKSRKRKGENPDFQRKPKTNRFSNFYDQTTDDDQYNESATRSYTSQGCRWMDNSSDNYSTNVDEDQGDEYNSMTKFGTKSNREQSYNRQKAQHYGNMKVHNTSKWSSFSSEESDQRTIDEHNVSVTAKPRNSSFNQAGVTRFCSKTDNIDHTETYLMKNKGQPIVSKWSSFGGESGQEIKNKPTESCTMENDRQKMSKWSSFGGDSGQQIREEPTESFINGDRQARSKCNVYEDHSSQLSSDYDPASQDNVDNRETDTRIYVEFNLPDQNHSPQSNHTIEMSKLRDTRTISETHTQGAFNNLPNNHSNLNESANRGSRHKDSVNQPSRNSKASAAKQTSSKWGQFLGGDSEEENFEGADHISGPNDNFTNESVIAGLSDGLDNDLMSGDRFQTNRNVLCAMNRPLQSGLSKSAYNRPEPKFNDSHLNPKLPVLESRPMKDSGSKVKLNQIDKSNVANKTLDVNSLFSTGDFTDDDFEL